MISADECPCSAPPPAAPPTLNIWNVLNETFEEPAWLEEAFVDVCQHNISVELSSRQGKVPHPICESACATCLPGLKKQPYFYRDRLLGPSWHRRRTLEDIVRTMAEDLEEERHGYGYGAGYGGLDDDEGGVAGGFEVYLGVAALVAVLVVRYSRRQRYLFRPHSAV